MSLAMQFDKLVQQRKELAAWWKMKDTVAAYDQTCFSLRMVAHCEVEFCGQHYAGAKNYHECPKFFIERVQKQIEDEKIGLVARAYEAEMRNLDQNINKLKEAILREFDASGV